MKTTNCYVYNIISSDPQNSIVQLYIENFEHHLRVNDVINNNNNLFNINGFYNPSNIEENETNSLFSGGWYVNISPLIEGNIPSQDYDWTSTVETPINLQPNYNPELSWSTILYDISNGLKPYTYNAKYTIENINDIKSGVLDSNCYLIDNSGNIFKITQYNMLNKNVVLTNLLDEDIPPTSDKLAYFYKTKNDAPMLSQINLLWLDQTARDKVQNIEKNVIWENRGIKVEIQNNQYSNVTKLKVAGADVLNFNTEGWNGGNFLEINTNSISDFGTF